MSSKSSSPTSGTTASSTQQINLSDSLLASSINLPERAVIAYVTFVPLSGSLQPTQVIEHARRSILTRNASTSVLESLLTNVNIASNPQLFVFSITSAEKASQAVSSLRGLQPDDLSVSSASFFTPEECFANNSVASPSSSSQLPLATLHHHFLEALRSRLIEDIVVAAHQAASSRGRQVQRLKGGILLSPPPHATEWSAEWEHCAHARPLIYAHLQVYLSPPVGDHPSRLLVHPVLRPTLFLPLSVTLPLPAGTPVTLLPYGTPAYYLTAYSGPSAGLIKQFNERLAGLGVTGWGDAPPACGPGFTRHRPAPPTTPRPTNGLVKPTIGLFSHQAPTSQTYTTSPFVIVWIAVENKQGEEKGVPAIWPTQLCISYTTSSDANETPCGRKMLSYIPALPTELQPSPPPHPAHAAKPVLSLPLPSPSIPGHSGPASASLVQTPTVPFSASTPTATSALSPAFELQVPCQISSPEAATRRPTPSYPPRPALSASPTSDSLRAFKSLTVTRRRPMSTVVGEVGEFVDAVARERERERERIRREREGGAGSSPRLSRVASSSVVPDPNQTQSNSGTPTALGNIPPAQSTSSIGLSLTHPQSVQANALGYADVPAVTVSNATPQSHAAPSNTFYPSPPHTNPPVVATMDMETSPVVEPVPLVADDETAKLSESSSERMDVAPDSKAPTVDAVAPNDSSATVQSGGSFDFGGWSDPVIRSSADSFLGIDMGMDMDMDFMSMGFDMAPPMNMAGVSSSSGPTDNAGASSYNLRSNTNMDFEDFTDDDFSFFDQPSRAPVSMDVSSAVPYGVPPTPSSDQLTASGLPSMASSGHSLGILSPLKFGDTGHQASADLPFSHGAVPWLDSSGSAFAETDTDIKFLPPDLAPPSAADSPDSHDGPLTPGATIRFDSGRVAPNFGAFDAIPFASSHKEADLKYSFGKFAPPPSPPPEEGHAPYGTAKQKSPRGDEWKFRYAAATDPRIGVVRKLRGIKRKTAEAHTPRMGAPSPLWTRDEEEWEWEEQRGARDVEKDDDADSASAGESDDALDDGDRDSVTDARSSTCSRPATPLPAYLPIGPTLLEARFAHSHLLPLSTPLRPPGAAVASTNMAVVPVPTSVPTPVSPAATLGAATEKSKSLEVAAAMVAKEVVENPLWAEAWRASMALSSATPAAKLRTDLWHVDLHAVSQLMTSLPAVEGPLNLRTLFDLSCSDSSDTKKETSLQGLEAPSVVVGKGDVALTASPTSLRFWEKLGLTPRGGSKNVTAFVLFEDDGEDNEQRAELWLKKISAAYAEKHFGSHSAGHSMHCTKDGLIPVRLDSAFRKNFVNIISNLPLHDQSLVLYMVTPVRIMSLSSPILRHVLFAIKKALKTHPDAQLLFHLLPQNAILSRYDDPAAQQAMLECTCLSVYDRVAKPVDRQVSKELAEAIAGSSQSMRRFLVTRAFTLARASPKVHYSRAPQTLGVMDRGTLLHVGYQVSSCGRWILAACTDERGESQEVGLWMTQTQLPAQSEEPSAADNEGDSSSAVSETSPETHVVSKVWQFAMQCAAKADIEWRVIITRLGIMEVLELDAWTSHLSSAVESPAVAASLNVSLWSADASTPWKVIPRRAVASPKRSRPESRAASFSSSKHSSLPPSLFIDAAASTCAFFPRHPPIPLTALPTFSEPALVLEPPSETGATSSSSLRDRATLPLLPLASSVLLRVPADGGVSSLSTLHIHLLYSGCVGMEPPASSPEEEERRSELLKDVTKNFYALSVLACSRTSLSSVGAGTLSLLPSHLAAVDAMHGAVSHDDDHGEVGSDP
ncbi:hypothetical protein HGRIS_009194 [Hohenbuehelia grisea]|uniref:Mediator of RNA polymerase II transcription subunit 13 n=1 Tax=Hohenbuehelia grisea TaxID=104357 RepID=A0ABR3J1T3_9AGAR